MTNITEERLRIYAPEEAASFLDKLRELLTERSIECYVVGGFIRDGLLGRTNTDIDVVVAGDALSIASSVAEAFRAKLVPLDDINQIARVVLPRSEGRWHFDFASMHGDVMEDLGYRDFTVNAIAVNLSESASGWSQVGVIDPLDGQQDLSSRTIRAVSEVSFQQDPARLLRAVRLCTTLGFSIEPDTEALMQRDRQLIAAVAPERLLVELGYILESRRAYDAIRLLDRLGMLDLLMPELTVARHVSQPKEHFCDVFDHSLETVAEVERLLHRSGDEETDDILLLSPWSSDIEKHFTQEIAGGRTRAGLLKLAGLLHDLGKPGTKTIEEDGRMRFLGHGPEGAKMAAGLMARLRFSSREIKMVQLITEHHMRPGYLVGEEMPTRRAIYRYFRDAAEVGIDTLFLGLADHLAARGPKLDLDEWRRHTETVKYMLSKWFEEQSTVVPPKLIDGHVLMDKLGLEPGPQLGVLLEAVREAQAAGEIQTADEALAYIRKRLERNG